MELHIEIYQLIIVSILAELLKESVIFDFKNDSFNPKENYYKWTKLNWFGIILGTIGIHILCPIFAIFYWVYKLITVGRS